MSHYTALLVQRRGSPTSAGAGWETFAPTIRISTVTGVRVASESPGGWQECDFTIPAERVRWAADTIPRYSLVWVFCGNERIFYGHIIQMIPDPDTGAIQVTCDGAYRRTEDTRMRSVWSDGDLTGLIPSVGSAQKGNAQVDANGNLVLGFGAGQPSGTGNYLNQGDYVAMDYFLFGEVASTRDAKRIDGFGITIQNMPSNNNLELRVYGLSSPGSGSPELIHTFTAANSPSGRQEISDASSGDNTTAWQTPAGYRVIRVGLWAASAISGFGTDQQAKITDFQVTTRGRTLTQRIIRSDTGSPLTTTQIAKDLWAQQGYDVSYLLTEEATLSTDQMVVGNIPESGIRADGMAFQEWSSPREILDALQAIDGYRVGMWGPTRNPPAASTTTMSSTAINSWYRQPAELVYDAWPDLGSPNYHVRLARGAEWTPDSQAEQLLSAAYVNYTTRKGRNQSVFYEDTSVENRMWEQGIHQAVDLVDRPARVGWYAVEPRIPVRL